MRKAEDKPKEIQDEQVVPAKQRKRTVRQKSGPTVGTTETVSPTMSSIVAPKILTFHIIGISPLLQNNPAAFIGGSTGADEVTTKKTYNNATEAELRVYRADSEYYHPTQAFVNAMFQAVKGMKFGKKFATSVIRGSVFVADPRTFLLGEDEKPIKSYAIDSQPVVIGKARVLRCRPRWDQWQAMVSLDVDTALVGEKHLKIALELAGRRIGVGDYRPEKGGGFGRFRVA